MTPSARRRSAGGSVRRFAAASVGALLALTLSAIVGPTAASAAVTVPINLPNGVSCTYTTPHLNRINWAAIVCSRMTFDMQMFVDCGDENGVYRQTAGPQIFDPEPYGRAFFCERGRFNVVVNGGVVLV